MYEGLIAETVTITGHGGDEIGAYFARPLGAGPFPGVIVIHHAPGWDEASKEIARKFAYHGYMAISPNLYHRFGPELAPDDAAAAARAGGWVPTDQFLGDAGGALTYLRGLPISNGKVGTIGYCSGGRQSFLAACELPIDAAVDCYGARVMQDSPPDFPIPMEAMIDRAPKISCPILGLFGVEDQNPSPAGGGPDRCRADPAGQGARVPLVRRRRARLLRGRPAVVPGRGRCRRLAPRL